MSAVGGIVGAAHEKQEACPLRGRALLRFALRSPCPARTNAGARDAAVQHSLENAATATCFSSERSNQPRRSMELEERLSYLENVRDWQSLVEELEKGIASSAATADKAQFHLRLGRVLERKVSRGRQGAQALSGRLQAEPGAGREPRGRPQHLLGPREAQHGPEAPRAGAQGGSRRRQGEPASPRARRRPLRSRRVGPRRVDVRAQSGRERWEERRGERVPRRRAGRGDRLAGAPGGAPPWRRSRPRRSARWRA